MEEHLENYLKDLVDKYYKAEDFNKKGDYFFAIVDVYEDLRNKGYESHMMMVLQNIIVLG